MHCEICNKYIFNDSKYINGKYYHNSCIEKLVQENQQLEQQLQQRDNIINYCKFQIEKEKDKFPCPLESERWLKGRISAFEEILNIDKGDE